MTSESLILVLVSLMTAGSLAASIVLVREDNRYWGWFLFFAWIGLMFLGSVIKNS